MAPGPAPHPLPSFSAWRFICSGLSLGRSRGQDGVWGEGWCDYPSAWNWEPLLPGPQPLPRLLPWGHAGKVFLGSCLTPSCPAATAVRSLVTLRLSGWVRPSGLGFPAFSSQEEALWSDSEAWRPGLLLGAIRPLPMDIKGLVSM